jgi:hypothetical protein
VGTVSVEEQLDRQREQQQDQMNLQGAQQRPPDYLERKEYLDTLIDSGLDPGTAEVVVNMLQQDFVLGNITDAEFHEIKHLRRVTLKKIYSFHPHPDAMMQGSLREDVYDDGRGLQPLSQQDKAKIDSFVRGALLRLSRSKGGFQQEEIGKTYAASEIKDRGNDDNGGWLSFG